MHGFSNPFRFRSQSAIGSELLHHAELGRLANEMVRSANLSYDKTGSLQPFAMTVGEGGTISQLACPEGRGERSKQETWRVLENGLSLIARQGNCKAVGLCPDVVRESLAVDATETAFFVEDHDGNAYRICLSRSEPKRLNPSRAEPRFFTATNRLRFLASSGR
jgi:hypothetical protein